MPAVGISTNLTTRPIGQRNLALAGAFQFLRQLGIPATTLFQNGNLLGQVLRRGAGRRTVLSISVIEAGQIVGKPLIRPLDQPFQLLAGEVAIGAIDRLQPGAVDRYQLTAKQIELAAEQHELAEHRFEGVAVVLAEISDGLEVGPQSAQQPDHFEIAGGLSFKPAAGSHPIDVAINVELEQVGRIVSWTAGVFRLNPGKACLIEVQIIDERVDEADRIVAMNVVIDPRRQKLGLVAITAFNVVHATILADQLAKRNPRQPENSRFHTVCLVFESESSVPKLLINA